MEVESYVDDQAQSSKARKTKEQKTGNGSY